MCVYATRSRNLRVHNVYAVHDNDTTNMTSSDRQKNTHTSRMEMKRQATGTSNWYCDDEEKSPLTVCVCTKLVSVEHWHRSTPSKRYDWKQEWISSLMHCIHSTTTHNPQPAHTHTSNPQALKRTERKTKNQMNNVNRMIYKPLLSYLCD